MLFIESIPFTKSIYKHLSDEEYKNLQTKLVEQPHLGKVIPGCGGIRKIRWTQKAKAHGKRSGVRIFYLYIEQLNYLHFLAILGKGEKGDLTQQEKKMLAKIATQLKNSARRKL